MPDRVASDRATECRLEQEQPGGLRRAFDSVRWYWASVMGDNHYERYLAHHERTHPGEDPMTKKEYWRERTDAQDTNPRSRCC